MRHTILVTGGAGFIGSAVIRYIVNHTDYRVINIDKLTYAGNLESLKSIEHSPLYSFQQVDICDQQQIQHIFQQYLPNIVIHLAAESHVDRSIDASGEFIQTNILGTYVLLQQAVDYYSKLSIEAQKIFRFHHISTDEVYGDLEKNHPPFHENTPYAPSSPYSASKASSNHLVRAWHRTFGLPTLITNCSNNYGPYQFPEKLVPLTILNALNGKNIPIYGDGEQIRDWLYVEDHAKALLHVALNGHIGESYNIGGNNEIANLDVVKKICAVLDKLAPSSHKNITQYGQLITHVEDRAGHDRRYAIDNTKIMNTLHWQPQETFDTGIEKTIQWYLDNQPWCNNAKEKYQGERLGLLKS